MGDFDTKQAEQRVGTIMGDCLGHYRKHLSGQTAIAFCCSVAHAEAVAHLFQSAGIAAASIDGTMDTGTTAGAAAAASGRSAQGAHQLRTHR
jgi:DNA repair protein RadD